MKKLLGILVLGLLLINFNSKAQSEEVDYIEILLNEGLVMRVDGNKWSVKFIPNGEMFSNWQGKTFKEDAKWIKVNNEGLFEISYNNVNSPPTIQNLKIDFKKMKYNIYGIADNGNKYNTKYKIIQPKKKDVKEIKQLVELRNDGTITKEEFEKAKKKVLKYKFPE